MGIRGDVFMVRCDKAGGLGLVLFGAGVLLGAFLKSGILAVLLASAALTAGAILMKKNGF